MNTYIHQTIKLLQYGKTILYPTDTIYGIGCDATNAKAVEKVFEIKKRRKEKSLIVLVKDIEMLKQFVVINNEIEKLIKSFEVPTTVIYSNPIGLAQNAVNADNTIAIRIPNQVFCQALITAFGKPIISTSANISGEKSPILFDDIATEIKNKVDFIVDEKYDTSTYKQPSKLLKINPDCSIEYLR